jgi:hypothetical protein
MNVELIETGKGFERYRITPKGNPDRYIIIQNNKPLIRGKLGLKHKPLTWTLKEGEVKDQRNYEKMIKEIEKVLEPPAPKKKGSTLPDRIPSTKNERKLKGKEGGTLGDRNK